MKKLFIFSLLCLLMAFGFVPRTQAQCTITSLPLTEGFENASGSLPDCFSRNPLGVASNNMVYPQVNAWMAHTGNKALRAFLINRPETSDSVYTFIFPQLGEQFAMTSMVLEFWALNYFNTSPWLVVGVMDDADDLSTFTSVQSLHSSATGTYEKFTVYFDQYQGTGRYIAIKFVNTPAAGQMVLDDIVLDAVADCSKVRDLAASNITSTSALLNWKPNDIGGTNHYNIRHVNLVTEQETYVTTTDTFYALTGLTPNTQYKTYVTVTCSNNVESDPDSVEFVTTNIPVAFPYMEDFEGADASLLADFSLTGTGVNQWCYGAAAGHPGHSLYISANNGVTNSYLVDSASNAYATLLVEFPANDLEYHLSFDYRCEGESAPAMALDYLTVCVMDATTTVPTSGAPTGTVVLNQAREVPDWTHFDVVLQNVAGTAKKIVFFWANNPYNSFSQGQPPAAIDNIVINGLTCPQPSALTASNVTSESATLSWTENGTTTDWIVYYKPSNGTGDYTTVTVSNNPSVELFSLLANTQYQFYVVADCGASDLSAPSELAYFRTGCGPISMLPYTEDFETGILEFDTMQDYIACWSRLFSNSAHYPYVDHYASDAHSGSHCLDFSNTPNCFDIAVMPELESGINVSDLMMTFYLAHNNFGYGNIGIFEVGVMTDPNSASTFIAVDTIDISSAGYSTYQEIQVSFANYTDFGKYIAFRMSNSYEYSGYQLDDITIEERPSCMYPSDFSALNVGTDSVTLTWTEQGDATSWNIQYGAPGFMPSDENTSLIVSTTTYTVGGLTNLTSYDFYVQADCGDHQSTWVGPVRVTTGMTIIGTLGFDTLTTCEAIICDDGGETGYYSSFCDYTLVLYPATVGSGLMITGSCNLYESSSWGGTTLTFIEGEGLGGSEIASYTGVHSDIAVSSSGPITIHFSAGYNTSEGFMLNVACSSCTPPTNVAVSNVQTNSATVSWTGSADSYAVYVSGAANGYFTTTNNTLQLNGLTSSSIYNVAVRSLCGADSSMLSPVVEFTTACDPLTVTEDTPWMEDFEGYVGNGNQPFVCWDRPVVSSYDAPFVYCGWSASCHSGENSAELKGENAMLVLPAFTNDIHTLQVSFWATATDVNTGTLDVGVITDITDPNSFELVGVCGQPGPRGPQGSTSNGLLMGPFNFSSVSATSGRIALRYNNSSSSESWNLDDFVVEISSDTTAPVQDPIIVTSPVTNITATTATVTGILVNPDNVPITARGFLLTTVSTGNEAEFTVESTSNNFSTELTNLTPSTNYTVKAFVTYNGTNHYGNEMTFTTLEQQGEPCETPTGLEVEETDINLNEYHYSAAIHWDNNSDVDHWNVQYKREDEDWTTVSVNENSYLLENCVCDWGYFVRVQAVCGEDNNSDWSEEEAFGIMVGINSYLENSVTLYPNPAKEYVDVRVDGDVNVKGVEVYDVYGKVVRTDVGANNDSPIRINVSDLSSGMYFVRVTTEQGVVTKRFVKK
jgi:hypothetical protein